MIRLSRAQARAYAVRHPELFAEVPGLRDVLARRAPRAPRAPSPGEEALALQLQEAGVAFVREHRFDETRRWRFDFAFLEARVAVEIDGGLWTRGRHSRADGKRADNEKANRAQALGWKVLRFDTDQATGGTACAAILAHLRRTP